MPQPITNVLLVGVGGQGILLASEILAKVAFEEGYDVKKSEVHGMAQRGGSVSSEIRFGPKIYSPLIRRGGADFLLALEKLEALRFIDYLKKEGLLIVNDLEIPPLMVSIGKEPYPKDIFANLKKRTSRIIKIRALKIAETLGNPKTFNLVLLGKLSTFLSFKASSWGKVIRQEVPSHTVEVNLKAFELGAKS
ncbi:MAG: indolepyruvate oxidoreductase subunit beta [bacterium]